LVGPPAAVAIVHVPTPASARRRVRSSLQKFVKLEAASGIVLLVATIVALSWANSPWAASYEAVWAHLRFWINDGLMTGFFFVVGLEIRREIHDGHLRTLRMAALPLIAAGGGVVVPALLYTAIASEPVLRSGWAIPTATDIAFAVGVLSVLGSRVPPALRVLLLSIAVIDDIVAICVIAMFYSTGFAPLGLLMAFAALGVVCAMRRLGVGRPIAFVFPGALVWAGFLSAGIHPAIAGVALGLLTPMVLDSGRGGPWSPVAWLETHLHPWVAFVVMPLFALANAGVTLAGLDLTGGHSVQVMAAIVLGLVVGKPLGVLGATALAVRLEICRLPAGVQWRGVALVGCVAGIGFTMAIFIAALAFPDARLLAAAKASVLAASLLAGVLGYAIGRASSRR
jgi:NhaA family Na+:H+ antiporter